jgi:hypothetical protein
MRGASVAEGIKRRENERTEARRGRLKPSASIAIWGGVIGFVVMIMAIAGTSWFTSH